MINYRRLQEQEKVACKKDSKENIVQKGMQEKISMSGAAARTGDLNKKGAQRYVKRMQKKGRQKMV